MRKTKSLGRITDLGYSVYQSDDRWSLEKNGKACDVAPCGATQSQAVKQFMDYLRIK